MEKHDLGEDTSQVVHRKAFQGILDPVEILADRNAGLAGEGRSMGTAVVGIGGEDEVAVAAAAAAADERFAGDVGIAAEAELVELAELG